MAKSKSSTVTKAAPKADEAQPEVKKTEVAKKTETVVTVPSDTPYQLNNEQVLKASKALIKFVGSKEDKSAKKNLLRDDEDSNDRAQAIWLNLTTKKFNTDVRKLKPIQIPLPHPIHDITTTTVCLIVKDPQRNFKDLIAVAGLSSTVTRVIGISKLRAKFKSFESLRLLRDSHDLFLADDNIVRMLPPILGKTFYNTTNKVPIAVETPPNNAEKLKRKIERALGSTMLHLTPSANTSIRVALSTFTAEQVAENVQAVVNAALGNKKLPGGWRGARSIHLKSPSSVALPIWLTPQLFDEEDVLTAEAAASKEQKFLEKQEKQNAKNKERAQKKKEKNQQKRAAIAPADEESEDDKSEGEEKKPAEEKITKSTEKLVDASVKEQKKRKRVVDVLDKGLDASVKEAKKLKAKKL
ncbi:ribosomal protein L1 [Morchella conica CCBAS932]|uniref:Ribosomal protein L1 n=1 Tax=Morchella conica CCBAS932 TaxID=1392247 RepID=A0A3N4KYJ5_9PEZI|nr:ribosomal protein L1 [Morchella conica CCBAS932]